MTDGLDPDDHDGAMKSRTVTRMPLSRKVVRAIWVPRGEGSAMLSGPALLLCQQHRRGRATGTACAGPPPSAVPSDPHLQSAVHSDPHVHESARPGHPKCG